MVGAGRLDLTLRPAAGKEVRTDLASKTFDPGPWSSAVLAVELVHARRWPRRLRVEQEGEHGLACLDSGRVLDVGDRAFAVVVVAGWAVAVAPGHEEDEHIAAANVVAAAFERLDALGHVPLHPDDVVAHAAEGQVDGGPMLDEVEVRGGDVDLHGTPVTISRTTTAPRTDGAVTASTLTQPRQHGKEPA